MTVREVLKVRGPRDTWHKEVYLLFYYLTNFYFTLVSYFPKCIFAHLTFSVEQDRKERKRERKQGEQHTGNGLGWNLASVVALRHVCRPRNPE